MTLFIGRGMAVLSLNQTPFKTLVKTCVMVLLYDNKFLYSYIKLLFYSLTFLPYYNVITFLNTKIGVLNNFKSWSDLSY